MAKEASEADEEAWKARKGFVKNRKGAAPKQLVKEASKKAKRLKFQNSLNPSTSTTKAPTEPRLLRPDSSSLPPAKNLKELGERLQKKLAALREKRGGVAKVGGKQSRKRKAGKLSKQKVGGKEEEVGKEAKKKAKVDVSALLAEQSKLSRKIAASMKSPAAATSDAISYGRLEVNGAVVAGMNASAVVDAKGVKGSKRNLLNVKRMLAKAEKNRARILELKQSSDESKRAQGEAEKWDQIEALAAGTVDAKESDPKMLKKRLKRLEKAKSKRAEKWKERSQKTKGAIKEKQEKRRENVQAHLQKKREHRLKKKGIVLDSASQAQAPGKGSKEAVKRKRRRPGFEGKHEGYLNSKKPKTDSDFKSSHDNRGSTKGNGHKQPNQQKKKAGKKARKKN